MSGEAFDGAPHGRHYGDDDALARLDEMIVAEQLWPQHAALLGLPIDESHNVGSPPGWTEAEQEAWEVWKAYGP